MSAKSASRLFRRKVLAALAATAACASAGRQSAATEAAAQTCTRPAFSQTDPDAELYGAAEGFPIPDAATGASSRLSDTKGSIFALIHLESRDGANGARRLVPMTRLGAYGRV